MKQNINRRVFLTTSLIGLGGIPVYSKILPFTSQGNAFQSKGGKLKLMATTDYTDNIVINHNGSRYGKPLSRDLEYYRNNKQFMDKKQLDQLHKFLASQGVVRHQWIFDSFWNYYENYPHNFDLIEEAVRSAHKYGIEFFAEIKPFEGGAIGNILPLTMPFPKDIIAVKDIRGIFPLVRPFVAANANLCIQRKPGTFECEGEISSIKLVKSDHRPTRLKAEHISIYTSATNNKFLLYNGPVSFEETMEKRFKFPYWRDECRIFNFNDLQLPPGHKYILLKCSRPDLNEDFSNEKGSIIELVNSEGKQMPVTLSSGQVSLEKHYNSFYQSKVSQKLYVYLQHKEVQAEINDMDKMREHYRYFYAFDSYYATDSIDIKKDTALAFVCGKPEFLLGDLHPIYPEVREHWLEMVKYCLDRKVDGINFRISNHVRTPEPWDYGFNKPVWQQTGGKTNYTDVSKVNGDSYTLFLQEVRDLIKKQGKSVTIHLESDILMEDNRPNKIGASPLNFEWQWKKWVAEIADELEFRGVFKLRPWNLERLIDIFATEANKYKKPFYFQGDFHGVHFDAMFNNVQEELNFVNEHPKLSGYVLYETANFTKVNENDELVGSKNLEDVLKNNW